MPYLIGTDEAGYGPNLGPLVISATVWHVDAAEACCLYERLGGVVARCVVARQPPRTGNQPGALPLAIADSKALFKPGEGIQRLERGVLALLALGGRSPQSWSELFELLLDADALDELCCVPWHKDFALNLPLAADPSDLAAVTASLRTGLATAGVRLMKIRSDAIFPERFNRLVAQHGSKGEVLSRLTLGLVASVLPACADEPIHILCDKHGGRNRYGALLQQQWPDPLIEIHGESTAVSIYRWILDGQRIEARFQARGESWLPAAAASMVSKYLRELAMRAFNDFWLLRLPELRPTAGYPSDAGRFKSAIAELQLALGIDDQVLWRER